MLISSTSNPLVKRIRALRLKKQRLRERAFFVDGIQPVWQALDHDAPVETLVVADDLLTSDAARARVEEARSSGIAVASVTAEVYAAISEREGPSGLGAIVTAREPDLEAVDVAPDSLLVALEGIGNPGNLGTIVRTADGAGACAVILVGDAADPYDPAAVKASMGALFAVSILRSGSMDELISWARERELSVITSSARATTRYSEAAYRLPALLVLGSEGEGLSADALALGDVQVRIDMGGSVSSLNVAVAAGILLYEIRRVTA